MEKQFSALKPLASLSESDRRTLAYEAVDPVVYSPSKGLDRPFAVAMRPGEAAHLEFEILGPVNNPVLVFRPQGDGKPFAVHIDVELKNGEKSVVRDRVPSLSGAWMVHISSADSAAACARIGIIKRYRRLGGEQF